MTKIAADIAELLSEMGPCLSSELIERLAKSGVSSVAARQRISRAGGVKKLTGVSFPNRAQFLYLQNQAGKRKFFDNLVLALKHYHTSSGRALIALEARGGAVPLAHFPAASGLPVEPAKGQLSHSTVLEQLQNVGLISITSTSNGEVVGLRDSPVLSNRRRAAVIAEDIILQVFRTWLINLGWTSSDSVRVRAENSAPKFGQFRFDLVGPSYLQSIVGFRHGRPVNGFIVADVLFDRHIRVPDLDPFLAKLAVLRSQNRSTNFQPALIADRFDSEALTLLRKKGCIIGKPENVLGFYLAERLRELISTLERAADALTKDATAVFGLMAKIAEIEGAALNLRGVVLELIIGHLFQVDGYHIEIREQVRSVGGDFVEIDVRASKSNELVCIECKGKSEGSLAGRSDVDFWITRTIPRIKSWFKSSYDASRQLRFEFYVSTDYDDDAKKLIKGMEKSGENSVTFYRGLDVVNRLKKSGEDSLVDIFREQFGPDKRSRDPQVRSTL